MRFARIDDGGGARLAVSGGDGRVRLLDGGAPGTTQGAEGTGALDVYVALCRRARGAGVAVSELAARLTDGVPPLPWRLEELGAGGRPRLLAPCVPAEVWGAAFTYARPGSGATAADGPPAGQDRPSRPVLFFKTTAGRCVGPGESVGARRDATAMIPEPELGVLLAADGEVLGYTIVNDVSSRDLPRENPFFLAYSKTFARCASLGPVVVPPEAVADPRALAVTCEVTRGGRTLWAEKGSTRGLAWEVGELVGHLLDHNVIPDGTVLATGTVLSPPADMNLAEGDVVRIEVEGIGLLENPVIAV